VPQIVGAPALAHRRADRGNEIGLQFSAGGRVRLHDRAHHSSPEISEREDAIAQCS